MSTTVMIRDTGVAAGHVLRLVAEGYSYDQILKANPGLIMGDIMATAELARQVIESLQDEHGDIDIGYEISFVFAKGKFVSLDKLRQQYPRAYVEWTDREDNSLAEMFKKGAKIDDIARQHQRQPGAVRIRLRRLGLIK